jgi:hypothetical protein
LALWLAAGALARRAFSSPASLEPWRLGRGDLYAFASLLVGMFLLSDALTQVVYWVVVWYTAQDTGFWEAASTGSMPNSVVYWVHVRAQVGLVLSKTILGIALVLGPERLRAAVLWLRREFSSSLLQEAPADATPGEPPRDGV